MRLASVLVSWVLALTAGAEMASPQAATSGVTALRSWIAAVNAHTPGSADDAAARVSALSCEERQALNTVMTLFLNGLTTNRWDSSDDIKKTVLDLARGLSVNPGASTFLKRAVVLHSDAAAHDTLTQVQLSVCPDLSRRVIKPKPDPRRGIPPNAGEVSESPFFTSTRLYLDKDGQVLGDVLANWNWSVARFLIRRLAPKPADDPFVGTWYHATTAYMFANGQYGEATPHLRSAADVLPDDARALFDRACYAEILGLPMHQVLLSDADISALRGQRSGDRSFSSAAFPPTDIGIPLAEATNADAERLFRRSLAVDPSYVEARVRLARLLDLRDRHEEAAAELKLALEKKPTGILAFYTHLFAGRTARELGQLEDAARHYRDAAALFPDAQSARLGLSQIALLQSDVAGALAPLERLGDRSAEDGADPWWQYHLAAGRDADALLGDLWRQVPR